MLGHVQLVVDIAVDRPALERRDRLARELERDRHVAEEPARGGLGDDRALVADDRLVDTGRVDVRLHRLEHAPGDDDDVDPLGPHPGDRLARARPELDVLRDQRAVEVAGERLDLAGEPFRKDQDFCVRKATRSASCLSLSDENVGMTPFGKPGTT